MPLVGKLASDTKKCEEVVQSLALTYESRKFIKGQSPKEATEFWQIEGRRTVLDKLAQAFKDARKAVNYVTTAPGLIRAYKAHSEALETARKNGATVRVMSIVSPENSSIAKEFSQVVEFKPSRNNFATSFATVDGREFVVIESKPDDPSTDRGTDVAIWTTNKVLVDLHEHLFDCIWRNSSKNDHRQHHNTLAQ